MTNRLSTLLATLLIFGASIALPARAIPLTLVMLTDTLLFGRAILSGDLFDLAPGMNLVAAKREDGGVPEHWQLGIFVNRFRFDGSGLHISEILGRHISRPPPHPDEGAFGPLLALSGNPYADLVDDFKGELVKEVRVLHDRPLHFDVMTTTLNDLNPADPKSVTAGFRKEFRMVIELRHIPEPASLPLAIAALTLLGLARQPRLDGQRAPA